MSEPRAADGMGARALVVAAATVLSRVLAVVREQMFAALFGSSAAADAYQVAFRVPNLLRDLFAEGALSAAFVPAFAARLRRDGRDAAFRLANAVIGAVLVVVGGTALVGVLASAGFVTLLAPDFDDVPGKFELATTLTRAMFPFLPLISLAAVAMGQLHAQDRFGVPALAAASFNVVAIGAGAVLLVSGTDARAAVMWWAAATVAGGAVQFAVQVPALRATGFRLRPRIDFADPGVRRIAALMAPAALGLAATQINLFVNTSFASGEPGAVSWLSYAFRLIQLPIGVFGVAVATISAARLANLVADDRTGDMGATLDRALRLVAFLTIPCAAGLAALALPVCRLLFERGEFGPTDTERTAAAVAPFAAGIYCTAAVKVAAPLFYATGRARGPLAATLLAVAVNVAAGVWLHPIAGFAGLALGTSLGAAANLAALVALAPRASVRLDLASLGSQLLRVTVAAVACAAVAAPAHDAVAATLGTATLTARAAAVTAGIGAGATAYVAACALLRVRELGDAAAAVRARVRARR